MKKFYEKPDASVLIIPLADILTVSGGDGDLMEEDPYGNAV